MQVKDFVNNPIEKETENQLNEVNIEKLKSNSNMSESRKNSMSFNLDMSQCSKKDEEIFKMKLNGHSNSNSFSMCHKIHAFLCGLKYSILIVEI